MIDIWKHYKLCRKRGMSPLTSFYYAWTIR